MAGFLSGWLFGVRFQIARGGLGYLKISGLRQDELKSPLRFFR